MISPNTDFALRTVTESGDVPKARLMNARHAQALYFRMAEAAKPRLNRCATMQGVFDGNPPYDSRRLRNRGESWRSNFNSLEGAARKDAGKVPYYDLFSTAATYADCPTEIEGPYVSADYASRCRSERFDAMIRAWPGLDAQFWTMLDDLILFNKGFVWWPRPDSWQFKRIPWQKVLFPDGTSVDSEDWELFAIEHEWPLHRLYSFVRDEEAAARAGWNIKAVWKAIYNAAPKNVINGNGDDPMAMQAALKANELYISAQSSTVQAASLYIREFDGNWSRMMVRTGGKSGRETSDGATASRPVAPIDMEQDSMDAPKLKLTDTDWLFFKQRVGEHVNQILCPFIFEMANGNINAIEGLAPKTVSMLMSKDRLLNGMNDNGMLRGNVTVRPLNAGARNKMMVMQVTGGGVNVVPTDVEVLNGTIFGDIESALAINADMDRRLDANTGIYRPQFEKPQGNPESATAANIRFSQATVLTNSAVNRFYRQMDKLYAEVYRRVALIPLPPSSRDPGVKAAIEFRKALKNEGLSQKQIEDAPECVIAVRTIGNGSPVMRQQVAQALLQGYSLYGPRGRQKSLEMYVSSWAGQHGVKSILPPQDTAQVPTRDDYDAVGENADAQTGAPILIAAWQDHVQHSQVHLKAAYGAVQSVQGGADPSMPFTFLQEMLPHIEQHIQMVGNEALQKELLGEFKQLQQAASAVEEAAKKQFEQRGQQQQLAFEQQTQLMAVQHDAKVKEFKAQTAAQLRQQKQSFEMQLEQERVKQDLALKDAQAAAEIQRNTAKTAADIQTQQAATAHQVALKKEESAHDQKLAEHKTQREEVRKDREHQAKQKEKAEDREEKKAKEKSESEKPKEQTPVQPINVNLDVHMPKNEKKTVIFKRGEDGQLKGEVNYGE